MVVNGEQNKLLLHFLNHGKENYTITNAAASYHDPTRHWTLLRNASTLKYNVPLPAGANFSVPFQVFSEFRPQDVGLTVWANILDGSGATHRHVAMNSTVQVVEQAHSWFDPALLFMYLIIAAGLTLVGYFGYNALRAKYFPKRKKSAQHFYTSGPRKMLVPADTTDKPYPASAQPYEEEWIPEHLRKRTTPSKSKKGRVIAGETTSGGEQTSGGETSGGERKKGKGKRK